MPDLVWRTDRHGGYSAFPSTEGIHQPARCTHCHGVYDLGTVEVTARYTDCSMWKAPCCGLLVDDRGPFWKSRPDFERIDWRADDV